MTSPSRSASRGGRRWVGRSVGRKELRTHAAGSVGWLNGLGWEEVGGPVGGAGSVGWVVGSIDGAGGGRSVGWLDGLTD